MECSTWLSPREATLSASRFLINRYRTIVHHGTLLGYRCQSSAKDSDRSGGQVVQGVLPACELCGCRRTVGISVALLSCGVPLILHLAERDHRDRPQERPVAVGACIMK